MKIKYFKNEFYLQAKKQRNKTLLIYFFIALTYLILTVGLFLWYGTLPYKDEKIATVKFIHYSITAVFVFISVVYFGIKFKRINKYTEGTRLHNIRDENNLKSFLVIKNPFHDS